MLPPVEVTDCGAGVADNANTGPSATAAPPPPSPLFPPATMSGPAVPPRAAHDPNSATLRPNRTKALLKAGGTAFIAAGELNWSGDRCA